MDWPCMNKEQSGVGERTSAWSSEGGWVACRVQTEVNSNNPDVWGLLWTRQDGGWSQIGQDNTERREQGGTQRTYRAPQLRLRSTQVTSCDRH